MANAEKSSGFKYNNNILYKNPIIFKNFLEKCIFNKEERDIMQIREEKKTFS